MNKKELKNNDVVANSVDNENKVRENEAGYIMPDESGCSPEFSEGCIINE